jgi:hypothetical protein
MAQKNERREQSVTQIGSVPDVDIGGFNVLQILGIKNHRIQT